MSWFHFFSGYAGIIHKKEYFSLHLNPFKEHHIQQLLDDFQGIPGILLQHLFFSGSFTCSLPGRLPPLFLLSLFLLQLTLTVIILWIGVTASGELRLTGNPDFLSQHLIRVEKTHDFSIHILQCPIYTADSPVNWGPVFFFPQSRGKFILMDNKILHYVQISLEIHSL